MNYIRNIRLGYPLLLGGGRECRGGSKGRGGCGEGVPRTGLKSASSKYVNVTDGECSRFKISSPPPSLAPFYTYPSPLNYT